MTDWLFYGFVGAQWHSKNMHDDQGKDSGHWPNVIDPVRVYTTGVCIYPPDR